MNRFFRSRWNAALGTWVAVSEQCRARGKPARSAVKAGAHTAGFQSTPGPSGVEDTCSVIARRAAGTVAAVLALAAASTSTAWAVTCTADANGSYLAGWTGGAYGVACNVVPATNGSPTTLGSGASWYVLARSNLAVGSDVVTIGTTNVSYAGANGFALIGNQYLTHGSIRFGDVTATLSNNGAGGGINALGTHSTVPLSGSNFRLTANSVYTGGNSSGGVGSYAILAGSSVVSGEAAVANNGKFSTVTLDNATIDQTASGGTTQPVLNTGLRGIQGAYLDSGNGSSGKIEIKGTLDMTLTGQRIEGIYVSGAASDANGNEAVSQVILNNSTIKMVKSAGATYDSSAIKIGKARAVGGGKGLVVSNGALKIDMDAGWGSGTGSFLYAYQPYMSPAIKMAGSGSQLLANGPGSSADINAARSVLAIGVMDWRPIILPSGKTEADYSTDSQGIRAEFGNANVRTQSATAPLLLVDSGQQDVKVLFDRGSRLTAASDGYLADIVKYRASTAASSLRLTLDNGSSMTGLTNKAYANSTLDIDLNHGATWNLAEKTTDAVATSTFDTLTMAGGATLNAVKTGTAPAQFILKGNVASTASTLNLADGKAGDVLTIQGDYVGKGGLLKLDTALGNDSSLTDRLAVTGSTGGSTRIRVQNAGGVGAQTVNGIKVVDVGGISAAGSFTLAAPVQQGAYEYFLYQGVGGVNPDPVNNNDWYLLSQYVPPPPPAPAPPPPPAPGPDPQPPAPPAPPAPSPAPQVLRPAIPGYVLGPRLGNEVGLAVLDTLHRREGDQRTLPTTDGDTTQAWARVSGARLRTQGERQFGASQSLSFMQLGRDVHTTHEDGANDSSQSHTRTGVALALGDGRADVYDLHRRAAGRGDVSGEVNTRLVTLSAYHTRYNDEGAYLDLVGQLHQVRNSYRDMYRAGAKQRGTGGGLSVEVGQPWRLGESRWSVEPQAQLRYLSTRYRGFSDSISSVDGQTMQSLRGRLGVRIALDRDPAARMPSAVEPFYVTADLLHDFKQPSAVRVANLTLFESSGARTWLELGLGAQRILQPGVVLYGGLQFQRSLGGEGSRSGLGGQLGLRARW